MSEIAITHAQPIEFDLLAISVHVELLHKFAKGLDGKFVVSVFNDNAPGTITHHRVGETKDMITAITARISSGS